MYCHIYYEEKKKMAERTDIAIIALVLIGILISSGTMIYTSTVIGSLSTMSSDVSTLTTSVGNLTSSVKDLATITADLAKSFNLTITDLEARLAAIEASLAVRETLIVGTTDSVELTLDPAQAYDYFGWNILQQIGSTLVSVKPGSATGADFVPDLALSWNSSSDLTTWDFTLRQDIKFPDGTTLTASDVKYSFDRAIALIPSIPEGAPAGLGYDLIFNRTEVLSTYKVRFHLNFPFSPFLGIVSARSSTIVQQSYAPMSQVNYTAGDARASTPVAFVGPYVLSRWERVGGRDVEIKLDANSKYWNLASGYPKLRYIIFKFYPDAATLRLAIEAGDVDMAFRHISPTDVLDLEDNPNLRTWWGTGAFIQYLCFQENRAPFDDARVRMAVAAALNRTDMTETVFLGLSEPLYSIIPPGMLGHSEAFKDAGLDANYSLTQTLLTQAGYSPSNPLQFDLWYESSGHYPSSADQALLYKESIEAAWPGAIQVTLKSADWASYKLNRDQEIMDAYVYGWYPDYVDPDDYAFLYWATWLHTNYSNATQVSLYDQARATDNATLRTQLYAAIDAIAADQCSVIPLYVSTAWAVTKPSVYGLFLDITQDLRYWLISK
jgi:peptide/nickel transport system substrate-binding protein